MCTAENRPEVKIGFPPSTCVFECQRVRAPARFSAARRSTLRTHSADTCQVYFTWIVQIETPDASNASTTKEAEKFLVSVFGRLKEDYEAAVEGIKKHLMRESEPSKLLFFGELIGGHSFSPKMVSCSSVRCCLEGGDPQMKL